MSPHKITYSKKREFPQKEKREKSHLQRGKSLSGSETKTRNATTVGAIRRSIGPPVELMRRRAEGTTLARRGRRQRRRRRRRREAQ